MPWKFVNDSQKLQTQPELGKQHIAGWQGIVCTDHKAILVSIVLHKLATLLYSTKMNLNEYAAYLRHI